MFTNDEPLGPYVTPQRLHETSNKRAFKSVYDENNFLSRENLKSNPNILLGRRGSGKTALLFHLRFDGGYTFSSKLESENIFADVASQIVSLFERSKRNDVLVETVGRFWRKLICSTVLCGFHNKFANHRRVGRHPRMAEVTDFLERSNLINRRSSRVILNTLINAAEAVFDREFDFIADFLDSHFEVEMGFNTAWDAFCEIMNEQNAKAIVLIDSLEQFPIARKDMREALAGLLHFVGEFDLEYPPIHITLCLPAELHEDFGDISDNFEKDFRKVLSLHWGPLELFQMCGHRFSIFIRHNPELFDKQVGLLSDNPSRDEVWGFWRQFLPEQIQNRYGAPEDPISYISRHTQLLPRHFLNIINKIAMLSIAGRAEETGFSEDDIIKGVRLGESVICDGVFSGFKQKYPLARDVCKLVLPKIGNRVRYNELQVVNRTHGKGIIKDADDLLEMLIRLGVLGRYTESKGVYDLCRFEYTYNGSMPYSTDDLFGVHPAFSGQFGNNLRNGAHLRNMDHRPIYPIEQFSGERTGTGALDRD
jgi:hypothetical protein